MSKELAGQPYQPSNGTEGACFFEAWCCHCARDKAMSEGKDFDECDDNEKCELIANSMAFKPGDAQYPSEWKYDDKGIPCCTAFVEAGSSIPPARDDRTLDLFAEAVK